MILDPRREVIGQPPLEPQLASKITATTDHNQRYGLILHRYTGCVSIRDFYFHSLSASELSHYTPFKPDTQARIPPPIVLLRGCSRIIRHTNLASTLKNASIYTSCVVPPKKKADHCAASIDDNVWVILYTQCGMANSFLVITFSLC